jgi:dipeptidyl aminopeptidase/acylaminoacyl peptidase
MLAQSGINALTFNYSGTYESEGSVSWDNMQSDIHAAFTFLRQTENIIQYQIDTSKIYLGGWCTGGGMALTYAACHPGVKEVFSVAPSDQTEFMKLYISNPDVKKMMDKSFGDITYPEGHLRFETGASPQEIAEAGIDKINPVFDLKKCAPLLADKNILLIGGWNDNQTTMEVFILPLYRALQKEGAKNVRFIAFQDDHYFQKSRSELAEEIIQWLKANSEQE